MAFSPYARQTGAMVSSFEWDPAKDADNQLRHGVSFVEAQLAFLDSDRVIAKDLGHSTTESRYFCFGRVELGILTVRFTYRGEKIRILGAGYWRKGKKLYEAQRKVHK
jgi:uncharacterized DUF497 family protein